jgi:hypothetical protein
LLVTPTNFDLSALYLQKSLRIDPAQPLASTAGMLIELLPYGVGFHCNNINSEGTNIQERKETFDPYILFGVAIDEVKHHLSGAIPPEIIDSVTDDQLLVFAGNILSDPTAGLDSKSFIPAVQCLRKAIEIAPTHSLCQYTTMFLNQFQEDDGGNDETEAQTNHEDEDQWWEENLHKINSFGESVAHAAAKSGNADLVRQLVQEKVTIDEPDPYNVTPLLLAVAYGNTKVATILVDAGADVNHADQFNKTPLLQSVPSASVDFISKLIEKGADVNKKDNDGNGVLEIAKLAQRDDSVFMLLKHALNANDGADL